MKTQFVRNKVAEIWDMFAFIRPSALVKGRGETQRKAAAYNLKPNCL